MNNRPPTLGNMLSPVFHADHVVENNLVLRISQQSLVKGAWAFLQYVAALNVTHSGA